MLSNIISMFKRKLHDDFVLGLFSKTSDPGFIEIMGYGGFEVVRRVKFAPLGMRGVCRFVRAAR